MLMAYIDRRLAKNRAFVCVIANGHLAKQNETTTLHQRRYVNNGYNTINTSLAMF